MIRRRLRSAVTAYVILALAVGLSLVRTQQIAAESNRRLCKFTAASWDERNAIVEQFTEHSVLPQGVGITGLTDSGLATAIANGNRLKDQHRAYLLKLQGPRPKC